MRPLWSLFFVTINRREMEMDMLLSVIVPCFNEEESLPLFEKEMSEISKVIKQEYSLSLEYIYVDDGSGDRTLAILKEMHRKNPENRYISFSRNFGKEAAMYAGLKASKGDYVVIMDADLQDPPSLLPKMLGYVLSGEYDSAAARRSTRRGEPLLRSWFAKKFYRIINKASETEIADGARDYRLMTRQMVNAVLELSEYNRFSKGIFSWVGFQTKYLEYENVNRSAGKTKWNFRKLFIYALDGIAGFTTSPLLFAARIGFVFFILSILGIIFVIIRKLLYGDPTSGWPSLVCIILFISGVQLLCSGIMGEYLARIYLEVKNRPIYIEKESSEKE